MVNSLRWEGRAAVSGFAALRMLHTPLRVKGVRGKPKKGFLRH